MPERITLADVRQSADAISGRLRGPLRVEVQRRNGATALDLYDDRGCIKLLCLGSASTVYTYLRGMDEALDIIGR